MSAVSRNAPETSDAAHQATKPLKLLDLPREALGLIMEEASNHELAQLCRVSQAMRELAAAELYRNLNHTFRSDSYNREQPVLDYLAGYLETLATSDYNYAGHVKELFFDTALAGEAGEKACKEFSYEHTCGKFLNTLLLAVLKKTSCLEAFYWNCRVELSTAIYRALHRMPYLRRLHVRLQPGPSLHSTSSHVSAATITPQAVPMPPPGAVQVTPPMHTHNGFNAPPQPSYHNTQSKKLPVAEKLTRPTTFSKFRDLKTLSVLDMDTLECIPELAECIHHSSDTLKYLRLSLSDKLARKARKTPSAGSMSDHTVSDDDLSDVHIQTPTVGTSTNNFSGNALPESEKSQRSTQENALARIFEYASSTPQSEELKSATDIVIAKANQEIRIGLGTQTRDDVDKQFVMMLHSIFREARDKSKNAKSSPTLETLEKIEKAATKYLENQETSSKHPKVKAKKKAAQRAKSGHSYQWGPMGQPSFGSNASSSVTSQSQLNTFEFDDFLYNETPDLHQQTMMNQQAQQMALQQQQLQPQQPPYGHATVNQAANSVVFVPYPEPSAASPAPLFGASPKPTVSQYVPKMTKAGKAKPKVSPSPSSSQTASRPRSPSAEAISIDGSERDGLNEKGNTHTAKGPAGPQGLFDDDIDMDHPDEDGEEGEDQIFSNDSQINGDRDHDVGEGEADSETVKSVNGSASETERARLSEEPAGSREVAIGKGKQAIRDAPNEMASDAQTGQTQKTSPIPHHVESPVSKYLRLSHGLPLESLAIYLLPVKPSVLLRHIDMYSLKCLTLLNVGPQRTLWATLTKLNRQSPISLNSIYTDNATQSFLTFVNSLPAGQLEELFMLEHGPRAKVPQLHGCAKTLVDEEEIRKMILKKHMKGMKRLVIRNDDDDAWAIGPATVRLIGREGGKLRELGVQCGSNRFHSLVRVLPCLRQLYALQVTFIIDPVSQSAPMTMSYPSPHHPHHQTFPLTASGTILHELRNSVCDSLMHSHDFSLEYLGLSCVNGNSSGGSNGFGPAPVSLSRVYWEYVYGDGTSDDESGNKNWYSSEQDAKAARENAAEYGAEAKEEKELLVWTEDNVRMSDLEGSVRMWEKEILAGRL